MEEDMVRTKSEEKSEEKQELAPIKRENLPKELQSWWDAGLITEQGIRIGGMGILINKVGKLCKLTDKTNLNLYHVEQKLVR